MLEGEFFGEDEIVNNNNPNENYHQRTYSAFICSPKASVYVSSVQFFKKYIFERPNLLKKLREKYYIKKELWEKQLSNCMIQRKDIHYKEKSKANSHHREDSKTNQISVFSEKFTEENRPKNVDASNLMTNFNEKFTVKKSVVDLRSRISEMVHQKVFKNELNKFNKSMNSNITNDKFIGINDSNLLDSIEENTQTNNGSVSRKKKNNTLASHLQFINRKYEEMIKEKQKKPECFNFQGEKDDQFQSRVKIYLKGKFRRYFNKSSSEQELHGYQEKSVRKFNESLKKSLKILKEREKLDLNSLRLSFAEEKNITDSSRNMIAKNNKQLTYLKRIDMFNTSHILETSGSAVKLLKDKK